MNKTDLSKKISRKMSVKQAKVLQFLNTMEEILEDAFKDDDYITFQNFGTFTLWQQTERPGRNPKTGAPVTIKARKSIKFKPSKHLLNVINK